MCWPGWAWTGIEGLLLSAEDVQLGPVLSRSGATATVYKGMLYGNIEVCRVRSGKVQLRTL